MIRFNFYIIGLCLILSGCYSSIPSHNWNYGNYGKQESKLKGRTLVVIPFNKMEGLSSNQGLAISEMLYKELRRKTSVNIIYDDKLKDKQIQVKNYIEATYFLNGVTHGLSSVDTESFSLPEGAIWTTKFYSFSFVEFNDFKTYYGIENLAIAFSNISLHKEGSSKFQFNGEYLIWDYKENQYVSKERLGPIEEKSIDKIVESLAEFICIGNSAWLF